MFCLLFHSTSVLGVWIMFYFIVGKQAWVCCWFHVWAVFLVETLNCYKSTKESLEPSWFRWAKDVTFDLLQEKALDPTPLKSLISNKKVHDCQSNTYYRLGEGLPLQAFFSSSKECSRQNSDKNLIAKKDPSAKCLSSSVRTCPWMMS